MCSRHGISDGPEFALYGREGQVLFPFWHLACTKGSKAFPFESGWQRESHHDHAQADDALDPQRQPILYREASSG